MQSTDFLREGEKGRRGEGEKLASSVSSVSALTADSAKSKNFSEVLYVWNYTEWGGAQIYFLGIMREALKKYGVRAVMPSETKGKILDYFKQENIACSFFEGRIDAGKAQNIWGKLRRRLTDWNCNFRLARHLSGLDLRDKIIHIDAAPWNAFALLFYISLKTHVFHTQHISQPTTPTLRNRLTRLKFKLLSALPKFHLLASNEDMRASLGWYVGEKHYAQIPLAYTGVNTGEIRGALNQPLEREKLRAKYDLPAGRLLVFSLGSIIERKGFRVFLEAAGLLKTERPEIYFVWIGDGSSYAEMSDLIRQFGFEDLVKIIRPAEIGEARHDLLQLFRMADIYIHPSFAEGLPGAMLEAMALGKPVVASRVNAIPEAVIDGETGFLVEAGDAPKFADFILKLANDEQLRRRIADKGQKKVLENFTEERCAAVTLEFYEKCLQARGAVN